MIFLITGTVSEVPDDELTRVDSNNAGTTRTTTTTKTRTKKVVQQPAFTSTTTTKQYLRDGPLDGIRVNNVTGKIRKVKAGHPQEKNLNKFRSPPIVPTKSWKQFGNT
jgi:hypothetical protein